jgi:hypothetical protein
VLKQIFFDASVKIAATLHGKPVANLIALHASFVSTNGSIKFCDVHHVSLTNVDLPPALTAFVRLSSNRFALAQNRYHFVAITYRAHLISFHAIAGKTIV